MKYWTISNKNRTFESRLKSLLARMYRVSIETSPSLTTNQQIFRSVEVQNMSCSRSVMVQQGQNLTHGWHGMCTYIKKPTSRCGYRCLDIAAVFFATCFMYSRPWIHTRCSPTRGLKDRRFHGPEPGPFRSVDGQFCYGNYRILFSISSIQAPAPGRFPPSWCKLPIRICCHSSSFPTDAGERMREMERERETLCVRRKPTEFEVKCSSGKNRNLCFIFVIV